jgi:hypothetical protein
MGKGGVGKTTIAAAIAVDLAARGHEVLLTTTDPAAHLTETLAGDVPNLTVSRIDPAVETRSYRDHVMATKGAGPRRGGPRDAGRGPALALHRGDRGVPRRAGIEPFAWIVNQVLTNLIVRDPVLLSRQREQQAYIHEVAAQHATCVATVTWQIKPPIGVAALRHLSEERSQVTAAT